MRKLEEMEWWDKLVEVRNDFSLRELAEIFEATPGAINNALRRSGIRRKSAPPGPRSRRPDKGAAMAELKEQLGDLLQRSGRKSDGKPPAGDSAPPAADRATSRGGRRRIRASTLAKLEPYRAELGRATDAEIAKRAGVSIQTVARYRRELGISSSRGRKRKASSGESAASRRGRRSRIDRFSDLVGQVSDEQIAQLADVKVSAVQSYRRKNGIPAPGSAAAKLAAAKPVIAGPSAAQPAAAQPAAAQPAPAQPAPAQPAPAQPAADTSAAARPPVAGPSGLRAYRVELGERAVIVVAEDIVGAALKATASGETVGLIELIGEVLA